MKLFLLNAPRYLSYYTSILEKNKEQGILIITDDFHLLDVYYQILNELTNKPFIKIIILSEKYYKIKKVIIISSNIVVMLLAK